jgi:hypothetical protein
MGAKGAKPAATATSAPSNVQGAAPPSPVPTAMVNAAARAAAAAVAGAAAGPAIVPQMGQAWGEDAPAHVFETPPAGCHADAIK